MLLGQSHLEAVMRTHLKNRFGVSVELGTELVKFEQDEHSVSAWLVKSGGGRDGPTEEIVQMSYLVGCDGGKS